MITTGFHKIETYSFASFSDIENLFYEKREKLKMDFLDPAYIVIWKRYYLQYISLQVGEDGRYISELDQGSRWQGIPFVVIQMPILEMVPKIEAVIYMEDI